ncbi:MAG: hypothetical protein HY892_17890 [Deltaproteobacteria bacterium]|nr:hypothetical protein [Deltaproteobacteria bacterium]
MKPFALAALCICTLALGGAMIFLAMILLTILPQSLVVLLFAVLGLAILLVLIRFLSRGLPVRSAARNY